MDSLIDYLPPFLRNNREYGAIFGSEEIELESISSGSETVFKNFFISEADENGIRRFEKNLSITPKGTDSLDDRRFQVRARLTEGRPYTLGKLKNQLEILCGPEGYTIDTSQAFSLIVRVALTVKNNFEAVESLISRVAPCNMLVDLSLLYNQYAKFETFTHAQMAAYTNDQLRNEVI